jgi:hypothetical protein
MKKTYLLLALPILSIAISSCNENKAPNLTTDKAKLSYVIGQQIGAQLKKENLDIDSQAR